MIESLTQQIERLTQQLAKGLLKQGGTLAVAESCSGGWLAKVLTDIAGSSGWFNGGIVSYTNMAKQRLLNVSEGTLNEYGAVSEAVAGQMAEGALCVFDADIAVAITGIAGPGGGTVEKPVGLVCFAVKQSGKSVCSNSKKFAGNREEVRQQAVLMAIQLLAEKVID
ncbi:MAG: damage-inducible protein CinA [Piscirickettsiaceae bacterium]|nr:MAG: damage-inducible protein CinA [Piscirickettsiaceae bacterium]